jgi:hypothetical protein
MERRVTVNDRIERIRLETPEDWEPIEGSGALPEDLQEGLGEGAVEAPSARVASDAMGPCLYLGPQGQRCERAAVDGGYCPRHHSDPELHRPARDYTRVLVATVALVIIVWPYVADLVRDLIRWLASPR